MEKIVVRESVDPYLWNQRVISLNGPMQFTSEWTSFVCTKDNLQPLFLEGNLDGAPFAAIIYLSSSKKWPLSRWPSASADCIPLAKNRANALSEIALILRNRGVSEFQLNSFAYDGSSPTHLAPLGYEETARFEFVLSLDQSIEPAWNAMRPTLRSDIRRFERSGVLCRARSDREVVSALHCIEQETASRHRTQGKQGNPMREATYEALWDTLITTGRARVYLAENEGVPIASVVIGVCGENAYYLYGGATPNGLTLNAPKGLLWFAIQKEYEKGVREFNLGGMSASAAQPDSLDHGLYKFKTGFGATQRLCISGRKVLRPVLVSMQARLRGVIQSVRNKSTPPG